MRLNLNKRTLAARRTRGRELILDCLGSLVNLDGAVHVVEAACPHKGGPLDAGSIWDGKLECPWHHFLYDLATGANIYPANVYPSDMPELQAQLAPFTLVPVRVEARRVFVQLAAEQKTEKGKRKSGAARFE